MKCTVHIPSPLRGYTNDQKTVAANGDTIESLLADLDSQFPGIRFRMVDENGGIREHIKIFMNQQRAGALTDSINPPGVMHIICALSGG